MRHLNLMFSALVALGQLCGVGGSEAADLPVQSVAPAAASYNWTGCYLGGYVGGAWQSRDVNVCDPISTGGAFPAGTFYHPDANNSDAGNFNYNLGSNAPTGGGTLGCNWEGEFPLVLGVEAEGGYMKVAATNVVPYGLSTNDHSKSVTRVGDWQTALTGRAGLAWDRLLFYVKGGVGFTTIHGSYVDACAVAPCMPSLLTARGSSSQPFWVAGGGLEYAINNEWSVKAEALVLGMYKLFSVCGAGGGAASGSIFCARYNVEGVHTAKIGANYHFNAPVVARY